MTHPIKLVFLALILGGVLSACSYLPSLSTDNAEPETTATPVGAAIGEMCGGIAGIQCTDTDSYCAMEAGVCGQEADASGICQLKPQLCTMEYDPVCGCDGQTYSNGCMAAGAGVSVTHKGACNK